MPTPEEEFDAALAATKSPAEAEFDAALHASASPPVETAPPPTPAPSGPSPAADVPWYRSLGAELSGNPVVGNIGRKISGSLLTQPSSVDGIPASYEGDSPTASITREDSEQYAAHPYRHLASQAALSAPVVGLAAAGGAAAMAPLAATLESAGLGAGTAAALGRGLGAAATYAPMVGASQEGDLSHRSAATINHMIDHPVETAVGVGAPLAAEGLAGPIGRAGSKLVKKGNEGLARLGLGSAEINRLGSLGIDKLSNTGQKIRDAGLDKSRTLLDYLSPTKARTLYENAADKVAALGGEGGETGLIRNLEDQVLASPAKPLPNEAITDSPRSFGETPVDTESLVNKLRAKAGAAADSAEVTGPKTASDFHRQADRFPSASSELVGVDRQIARPPALPRYDVAPDMGAEPNLLLGADLPPPSVERPPAPAHGPVQQPLDFALAPEQRKLPLEGGQTAFDFPATNLATPQTPVDSAPQMSLPDLPLGAKTRPLPPRVANNARGGGVQMTPLDYYGKSMPEPPAGPVQGELPLETQLPLKGVPKFPTGPGLTPDKYAPRGVDMPASPGGKALGPDRPIVLDPPTTTGEFGGTTETVPAEGSVEPQYDLARAINDRRQIGNRLFDKKQRVAGQSFGQDAARSVAWNGLDDSIESTLDKAGSLADVPNGLLDSYRKARSEFTPAIGLLKGGVSGKAESELRAAGSALGWYDVPGRATQAAVSPGTKYNTGKALQGLAGLGQPGSALTTSSTAAQAGAAANKEAAAKNEGMKKNIFSSWYEDLLRLKPGT